MFKDKEMLLKEYPFLQDREYDGTLIKGKIMGLEIPKGWYKLFLQMCKDIKPLLEKADLLDKFYFIQVKEKYNQLRCYAVNSTQKVDEMLNKYEMMARNVCTICGKPATYETTSYIASYCDNCWKDYARHEVGEFFAPEFSFKKILFRKDGNITKKTSFKEEWDRYIKSKENNL